MVAGSITLRASDGRDFDAIDAMLARTYPRLLKNDYPPSVMVTAVPLVSRANPALVRSGTYYVAETARGEIIGAGGWTMAPQGRGVAEVRHLVVDWQHQRRGIGRRLMMGIFAEARVRGLDRLEARATRTAVPFYEAMGFDSLGEITVPLRPGIDFPVVAVRRFL
jgi:GNAT superfamily N-acetyltransferase